MTLLITVLAAVVVTVKWYKQENNDLMLGPLCFMFWGASLMWLGDAVWEYAELHEKFFTPAPGDMLNDAFLGLSVVAFALIVWLVILLVRDPRGVVRKALAKKQ